MHWAHGEQVLEERSLLAVVGDLHVTVDASTQRILNHRDRLRLRLRALQEAAIAPLRLMLGVACHAAELTVHKEHRVARHRHVADDDASRVSLCHRHERVHPACDILGHAVLLPDQVVRAPQLLSAIAQKLLDQRKARLRLHKLRERFCREMRECCCGLGEERFHGRVRTARVGSEVALGHRYRLRCLHVCRLLHELAKEHDQLELQAVTWRLLLQPAAEHRKRLRIDNQGAERAFPIHRPEQPRELRKRSLPLLALRAVVDFRRRSRKLLWLACSVKCSRQQSAQPLEMGPFLGSKSCIRKHANRVAVLTVRVEHRMQRDHIHKVRAILPIVRAPHGSHFRTADRRDHHTHSRCFRLFALKETAVLALHLGCWVAREPHHRLVAEGQRQTRDLHISDSNSVRQLIDNARELLEPCATVRNLHVEAGC